MRRVFTLGKSPEGFQAEKGEIGGFEDSCVTPVSGDLATHESAVALTPMSVAVIDCSP